MEMEEKTQTYTTEASGTQRMDERGHRYYAEIGTVRWVRRQCRTRCCAAGALCLPHISPRTAVPPKALTGRVFEPHAPSPPQAASPSPAAVKAACTLPPLRLYSQGEITMRISIKILPS